MVEPSASLDVTLRTDDPWVQFHEAVRTGLAVDTLGHSLVPGFLYQALLTFLKVIAPATAAAFVLGLAMNVAQVGFMFTLKPITPDIKKINPRCSFPTLIIGEKVIVGYKEKEIKEALGL